MLNPMPSPTAVTSPVCPDNNNRIITRSLYFTKTRFYCKDQCQESTQKMWMTHKTQTCTTSTTQHYSATAAKVMAKLEKVILMLENFKRQPSWKMAAILDIRSRKIKIQIPYSKKYMIWHQDHSNMTIIWGSIKKCIFWYSKWRSSWHFDRLKFFSKKVAHSKYLCQFWCLYPDLRFPRKNTAYSCPTMHCRSPGIFNMFRLLCEYDFESTTVCLSC